MLLIWGKRRRSVTVYVSQNVAERVVEMLKKGRDGYRFINDQTLRLANHGFTMEEIAEKIKFPPELDSHWAMRGYYGTLNFNVKGQFK